MDTSNDINHISFEPIYNQDLTLIYRQISIEHDMLFDVEEEKQFLIECIEKSFDKNFLQIDNKLILEDTNRLNNSFVTLIKHCVNQKTPYKKIHQIFIEYCDYFDLPYNKTYNLLHEKVQNLIKGGFIKIIGKKQFSKLVEKYTPEVNNIVTLFDMVKN